MEQGQTDRPETPAQTQRHLGYSDRLADGSEHARIGTVQSGDRQQAARLRSGSTAGLRCGARRSRGLKSHGHATNDPSFRAVRNHRTTPGVFDSADRTDSATIGSISVPESTPRFTAPFDASIRKNRGEVGSIHWPQSGPVPRYLYPGSASSLSWAFEPMGSVILSEDAASGQA